MTLYRASFLRIILLVSSRFGDALGIVQDHLDAKNYYAFNPAFDVPSPETWPSRGARRQDKTDRMDGTADRDGKAEQDAPPHRSALPNHHKTLDNTGC